MKKISEVLKIFKDPHSTRIEKYKKQYQELDELSNVAVELGDATAYKSLQSEMREVYFDYLTAIVIDAIYRLVPHVIILCLISFFIPVINIPFVGWQVNIFGAYLLAYFTYHMGGWLIRPMKARFGSKVKLNIFGFTSLKQNN